MSTTQYVWPPSASSSNASVGINGATAPTSSTQIAGENGGLLVPIAVTAGGNIIIDGSGTPVPVSGTVTANQGTAGASPWPTSAAQSGTWNITNVSGTVSLPTGASTSALQTTGNTALTTINTTLGSPFQAGGSIANTTFASTQSGTWDIRNVSGTVSLPTGASTSALQTTGNTSLASIATNTGNIPTVGQKAMAASLPIVVASDQSAIPISGTVTSNPRTNSNGSIVNTALSGTTASSASAPANAVGFILEAPSTNTDNIRWCIGGTASTTVGMLAEPGRDTGFVPCAATISVCATVSGTDAYSIQWILSS